VSDPGDAGTDRPAAAPRVDPGLQAEWARRFDRAGPRYTSYPTAVEFHHGVGVADYLEHLERADRREPGRPLSLYVHIPFCEKACTFCACHFIATPRREVASAYLEDLRREAELLAERLPHRRRLAQMQWGGGTPTYLSPAELERLHATIARSFDFEPGAELAIEVDPRVTTREQLATLARLGFNRLSMGVQDFTPGVQEAIGRGQTFEQTRALIDDARELGFGEGINLDLVYGLPRQDETSFALSLDRLLGLRPDRVAMYSFAYVPWTRRHQKRIDPTALPASAAKLALFLAARERLIGAGYEPIGIDHFALPHDELARAARARRLDRNFMGYTPTPASAMVALGVSGIGEVEGAFFQNERRLADYTATLDAGRLPIQRGHRLDDDDRLRQYVIRQLMCNFAVDKDEVRLRFGVDFDGHFEPELSRLEGLGDAGDAAADLAGLVIDRGRTLELSELGRIFARNVCAAFDRYLEARQAAGRPVYSRTI
jgi:oxygen-independent coproporphyrinogen-3 oxidase